MNGRDLREAGYQHIPSSADNRFLKGDTCVALWQKKVDDEHGRRYFVNFFEFDHSNLGVPTPIAFQCEVQFRRGREDEQTLTSTISLGKDATVAEYEAFAEELFVTMGFNHYESYVLSNRPAEPYQALHLAAENQRDEISRWLTKHGTYDGAAADVGDLPVEAPQTIAKKVKFMQETLALVADELLPKP